MGNVRAALNYTPSLAFVCVCVWSVNAFVLRTYECVRVYMYVCMYFWKERQRLQYCLINLFLCFFLFVCHFLV